MRLIIIALLCVLTLSAQTALPQFTDEEKAWIADNPVINVGSGDDWAPFNFVDKYGTFKGITKDYLDLIEEKSGLAVKLTVDKWAVVLQAFKEGKLDLLPAALYKKERENFGNFLPPHIKLRDFIYAREDDTTISRFEDLNGKTLVRIRGYAVLDPYLPHLKDVKIIEVGSVLELISAVHNKEADAFLEGQANINHVLKENMIGGLKSIAQTVSTPTTAHMLVKKDERILFDILKKSMQSISDAEHQTIMDRWISLNNQTPETVNIIIEERKLTLSGLVDSDAAIFFIALILLLGYSAYTQLTRGHILNVKFSTFNIEIIVFELVVISFLIYEMSVLDRTENALAKAYSDRFEMFLAADELRQSSDDLTHFARTYSVTGDAEYKSRYLDTLKIRNGKKARPENISKRIYWDLSESVRQQRHPDTEPKSLQEIIETLPFTPLERSKLKLAEDNSNELVNIETKAFIAVDQGDLEISAALLHSKAYYDAKHTIMLPIDEMLTLLDQRTESEIKLLKHDIKKQFFFVMIIAAFFLVGNIFIYFLLRDKINIPVAYLTDAIRRFDQGAKQVEKKTFYSDEIGYMIEQFFSMQRSIALKNEKLEEQKAFYNTLLDSQEQIIITTDGRQIFSVNESFYDFFAVDDIREFHETYDAMCISATFSVDVPDDYLRADMEGENWVDFIINRPFQHTFKVMIERGSHPFIFSVSATKLPMSESRQVSVVFTDITEMEHAKQEIEALHRRTKESIEYAALIQGALVPAQGLLRQHFDDYFSLWYPKDVVGGDIFLFEELDEAKEEVLLMVIDCTGHGVPGAFVTMLVKAIERQLVATIKRSGEVVSPARLLSIFNRSIKHLLKQEDEHSLSNAGFDGGILYYSKKENLIRYAGANTPLFVMHGSELKMIKSDRHSIGYKTSNADFVFTDHEIRVEQPSAIYLTTDGFFDQNGGPKSFPFGKKRFRELIMEYHSESMADQQEYFLDALVDYQGDEQRNDDITLVAFKVNPNTDEVE
jgi:serine phosphatase RsbU (regulator of sigma subunit)/ABC-type amino acid transport substrate-binding protein